MEIVKHVNPLSVASGASFSKEGQIMTAANLSGLVATGQKDALEAYIQLKNMLEIIELSMNAIKEDAIKEASKYHKSERVLMGVNFDVVNGSAAYNYEADAEYSRLKKELEDRRSLLKTATLTKDKGEVVDKDGAIVNPVPVSGGKAETIKITFKKDAEKFRLGYEQEPIITSRI